MTNIFEMVSAYMFAMSSLTHSFSFFLVVTHYFYESRIKYFYYFFMLDKIEIDMNENQWISIYPILLQAILYIWIWIYFPHDFISPKNNTFLFDLLFLLLMKSRVVTNAIAISYKMSSILFLLLNIFYTIWIRIVDI